MGPRGSARRHSTDGRRCQAFSRPVRAQSGALQGATRFPGASRGWRAACCVTLFRASRVTPFAGCGRCVAAPQRRGTPSGIQVEPRAFGGECSTSVVNGGHDSVRVGPLGVAVPSERRGTPVWPAASPTGAGSRPRQRDLRHMGGSLGGVMAGHREIRGVCRCDAPVRGRFEPLDIDIDLIGQVSNVIGRAEAPLGPPETQRIGELALQLPPMVVRFYARYLPGTEWPERFRAMVVNVESGELRVLGRSDEVPSK